MNLIQELGTNFVRERFNESLFVDENGNPCYITTKVRWEPRSVAAFRLSGSPEDVKKEQTNIPDNYFKDLSVFGTPALGWRMNGDGTYLVHFSKNNRMNNTGYHRGLNPRNIDRFVSPATRYLVETDNLKEDKYEQLATQAMLIMRPVYKSLRHGLEEMRKGNLYSFAASPVLAIIPAENEGQSIFFNTRLAAKISKEGELECPNPILSNYIKEHLQL